MSEGENGRRGETSSYPSCTATRSAVRAVRCFVNILWRSLTSLSTWAALLTPLATPVLIFFDDWDLHLQ